MEVKKAHENMRRDLSSSQIETLQVGMEKTELECLRKKEGEEVEGMESATFTVQSVQSW